jgi:hypothetical protein
LVISTRRTALGIFATATDEFETAQCNYQRALPVFHNLGDKDNEAIILNGMGFASRETGDIERSTGGTSNGESWNTDPGKLSTELGPDTTECCCAYNMMKLTRHLFGWSPEARFMDYYERTLFNHRLGTINPEDGAMMYYLPLGSGYRKTFGKPFDASGAARERVRRNTPS